MSDQQADEIENDIKFFNCRIQQITYRLESGDKEVTHWQTEERPELIARLQVMRGRLEAWKLKLPLTDQHE